MSLRRNFLLGTTAIAVSGCNAGFTFDQAVAQAAQDVATIANGLQGTLTQLGSLNIPGLTPAIVSTVGVAVAGLQSLAVAIGNVSTQASAQPIVQKVETYVNTIVSALATLPLPSPISLALQAATILIPIIEAALNMVVTVVAPKATSMTAAQARLTLVTAGAGQVNPGLKK